MAEALRANIGSKSAISLQRSPVDQTYRYRSPPNILLLREQGQNDLSYGIKYLEIFLPRCWAVLSPVPALQQILLWTPSLYSTPSNDDHTQFIRDVSCWHHTPAFTNSDKIQVHFYVCGRFFSWQRLFRSRIKKVKRLSECWWSKCTDDWGLL